jgi:hypothetical protein
MNGYSFSISKNHFSLSFVNDTDEQHGWPDRYKWSHYSIMHRLFNFMKQRGFSIGRDPRIQEHYKAINKDHWRGRKGDLEFKAHRYPRGFSIDFFQNINIENVNGGEYDSNKFRKAPYLVRLNWIIETKKMGEFLEELGIENNSEVETKYSEDSVKAHLVKSWHKPQKDMNFKLKDLDGTTDESSCNNTDRDKKTIYNGQVKYFRDRRGRLVRGKVYHNINNMWWVILNDTEYTNEASFLLFDATENDFKERRIQRNKKDAFETSTIAARGYFSKKGLSYNDIKRCDIEKLHEFLDKEISKGSCLETMKINPKIKTKCKSNKKIIHAYMYVDAHYFSKRECISFNSNGFIGFAGWASSNNVRPIIKGFIKWCDYLAAKKTA